MGRCCFEDMFWQHVYSSGIFLVIINLIMQFFELTMPFEDLFMLTKNDTKNCMKFILKKTWVESTYFNCLLDFVDLDVLQQKKVIWSPREGMVARFQMWAWDLQCNLSQSCTAGVIGHRHFMYWFSHSKTKIASVVFFLGVGVAWFVVSVLGVIGDCFRARWKSGDLCEIL